MTGIEDLSGFDDAMIARIVEKTGEKTMREIVELFFEHVPAKVATVVGCSTQADLAAATAAAHSIRSSAAMLGATGLASVCERLESIAFTGDHEVFAQRIPDFEAAYDHAATKLEALRQQATTPARKPSIAVVEDNPDNRLLLRALLEARYEIVEYEDGLAALEGLRARRPDAVLLDISLPGMDGSEVLRFVREDPALADLPVIALTAHAMVSDRGRFLAEGFDEYLAKPITDENLLFEAIGRMLARET